MIVIAGLVILAAAVISGVACPVGAAPGRAGRQKRWPSRPPMPPRSDPR